MELLEKFRAFVSEKDLFSEEDRILIALSGGIDSVVLLHLLKWSGYEVAAAHCNFKLRGSESDEDERFCQAITGQLNIPFFGRSFNTKNEAEREGVSLQMAARELRYEWFEELCVEQGFDYLATAHHLNDSIETFFVNFTKGCGIRGLHGIPVKNERKVRPLLFATRQEIEFFATQNGITFREDASNAKRKYVRNKIRHEVIPHLKSINPEFEKSARETISRIGDAEQLFDFAIRHFKSVLYTAVDANNSRLDLQALKKAPAAKTLLYELLKDKGLHPDQAAQILDANTGAVFYTKQYRLLVDRGELVVELEPVDTAFEEIRIEKDTRRIKFNGGELEFSLADHPPKKFPAASDQIFLDAAKLKFPLKVRSWQPGDTFKPLGMQGKRKKLKDFFNDVKIPLFDKDRIRILTDNDDEIIWIIGHRLDERFKVRSTTRKCFKVLFTKP